MGPLPGYGGEGGLGNPENEDTTLTVGKKMVLLVVALVIFHLLALVSSAQIVSLHKVLSLLLYMKVYNFKVTYVINMIYEMCM